MADTDDVDARVGVGIQALRETLGLTQARLAEAMAQAGHAWHQQTVVKTEKGLRPLRLAEAFDLASALHVDVTELDPRHAPSARVDNVRRHLHQWAQAEARFEEAGVALRAAAREVRTAAADAGEALPPAIAAEVAAVLCAPSPAGERAGGPPGSPPIPDARP